MSSVHSGVATDMEFVAKQWLQGVDVAFQLHNFEFVFVELDGCSWAYDKGNHRFEPEEIACEAGLEYF